MKKLVTILMLVLLIGGLSIPLQGISGVNEEVQAASIKLNKTSLSIDIGKSSTLRVVGTKNKVKWSSSNKKIAKVTAKGLVKGLKKGKCKITATATSGKKATVTIKVK